MVEPSNSPVLEMSPAGLQLRSFVYFHGRPDARRIANSPRIAASPCKASRTGPISQDNTAFGTIPTPVTVSSPISLAKAAQPRLHRPLS